MKLNKHNISTDIHPTLADEMAKALADEIDWEIMCELMKSIGWTQIEIDRPSTEDILVWCEKNLNGKYKVHSYTWMFERAEDATWFTLRWSS
jgi:hypothetical protein